MTKNIRTGFFATALLVGFGAPVFAADNVTQTPAARPAQAAAPAVSGSATTTAPRVTGSVQTPAAQAPARQAATTATPATPAHPGGQVTAPRPANGQAQAPVRPAAPAGTASTTPAPSTTRAN